MANSVCKVLVTEAALQNFAVNDGDASAGAIVDFRGVVRKLEDQRAIDGIDYEGNGERAMNWANRLTLSRLLLTIVFVAALNSSWQYGRTVALAVFLVAGISDFVDGEIARRYGIVTNFGKLMDPLVDKIMVA